MPDSSIRESLVFSKYQINHDNDDRNGESDSFVFALLGEVKRQVGVIIGTSLLLIICIIMYILSPAWQTLTIKGWLSILTTIFTVSIILMNYWPSSYVMFGGLAFCYGMGLTDSTGAFAGFSNTGVMTDALMFIVAKTLELSGVLDYVTQYILRKPKNIFIAQFRLYFVVALLSMGINNTPITIMMIPVVQSWSQSIHFNASKFLLPMAYAIILGGVCTTIGISTNILLVGMAEGVSDEIKIGFFDTAIPGIPVLIVGIIYCILFAPLILPDVSGANFKPSYPSSSIVDLKQSINTTHHKKDDDDDVGDNNNKEDSETNIRESSELKPNQRRMYTSSFGIPSNSPFIGKTLKFSKLLEIPGIQLIEIQHKNVNNNDEDGDVSENTDDSEDDRQMLDFRTQSNNYSSINESTNEAYELIPDIQREEKICSIIDENQKLKKGDILLFKGALRDMYRVYKVNGLKPIDIRDVKKLVGEKRTIVEVVLSSSSPLVGQSVKKSKFRKKYNAVILGVYRSSEDLNQRIGTIVLQGGDVLLLETTTDFLKLYQNSPEFVFVSDQSDDKEAEPQTQTRKEFIKMIIVCLLLIIMIILSALQLYSTLQGTCFLIVIYVAMKSITWSQSLSSLQANTLLVISCAFALGDSLTEQNATTVIADSLISIFSIFGRIGVIGGLFICTALLCTIISNTAVVTIMFPIAQQFAYSANISIKCVTITVMLASSCLFPSPLGYQVLMAVHAVGGYSFSDFLKFGIPLSVIYFLISVPIIYVVWADDFVPSEQYLYS